MVKIADRVHRVNHMALDSEGQDMNNTLVLRILAGIGLIGIAAVHLDIAKDYKGLGKHPLALTDQFYAQSAMAIVLILALAVRPHFLVWAATALFAVGSLAVLVYSRYNTIPIYGFDPGFMESWSAKGAKLAAASEALTILAAGAGAFLSKPARA
jgi:hypothetical protein